MTLTTFPCRFFGPVASGKGRRASAAVTSEAHKCDEDALCFWRKQKKHHEFCPVFMIEISFTIGPDFLLSTVDPKEL